MSYKIVVDSCCELPEKYLNDSRFERVPLSLEVGDYHILDDENFDQKRFLQKVAACPTCPKSSCPSPERFMKAYQADVDHVYCVTLSSHLSGSYNSAVLGKTLYEEEFGEKSIYICDSESASIGETQIAMKIMELEESGNLTFEQIVSEIEAFRSTMNTYFVLDNLETLRKNGRLSSVKAFIASTSCAIAIESPTGMPPSCFVSFILYYPAFLFAQNISEMRKSFSQLYFFTRRNF